MAKTKGTLELGARSAEIVQSAIQHWLESELLSESQATELANTVVARTFDWEKFAKYSIRLALVSLAIAVSSLVFSASFLRIIAVIIALPAGLRGFVTALIAVGIHVFAHDRSLKLPKQKYVNEGIHGIGALVFALAALQFVEQLSFYYLREHEISSPEEKSNKGEEGKDGDAAREQRKREYAVRSRLMGNAIWCVTVGLAVVYATVALLSKSNLIWSCAIMVFSSCIGGSGGYFGGGYWVDMESPFLFIGFGTFLLATSRLMSSYVITEPLWSTTRVWGLLYSFVSLWILSVWGYDDYFERDAKKYLLSRRVRMALWSLVFLVASATSLWHGLRYDDSTTKGYGLTFLGINLYTKYFECFWGWSKPVFFALLACSLAVIGKYAENVWNMRVEELKLI